jgi:tRNA(Arg) A34 adenosine deaminase TadA
MATGLHERFMALAIEQAAAARRAGDAPIGAVIIRGDQCIAAAHNTEIIDNDVTNHAETTAISRACRRLGRRDLSDCTLYSSNEPCNMCGAAALFACIPRIVYALSRDDLPQVFRPRRVRLEHLLPDAQQPVEIVAGISREEAIINWSTVNRPIRVTPGAALNGQLT